MVQAAAFNNPFSAASIEASATLCQEIIAAVPKEALPFPFLHENLSFLVNTRLLQEISSTSPDFIAAMVIAVCRYLEALAHDIETASVQVGLAQLPTIKRAIASLQTVIDQEFQGLNQQVWVNRQSKGL